MSRACVWVSVREWQHNLGVCVCVCGLIVVLTTGLIRARLDFGTLMCIGSDNFRFFELCTDIY